MPPRKQQNIFTSSLSGNNVQNLTNKQRTKLKTYADEKVLQVKNISREADARRQRRQSVYKRRGVKPNDIVALQDLLYNEGYFGDIPYEKAVDGIMGKMTTDAINRKKLSEQSKKSTSNNDSKTTFLNKVIDATKIIGSPISAPLQMISNYEPIRFYANDVAKGLLHTIGVDTPSNIRTEKDMSNEFNNQAQELAALAIASGENSISPRVYRLYNRSHGRKATYADFTNPLKFLNPGLRVEYSDGGMSMSKSKNSNGYTVVLTDEAAWDPDKGKKYSALSFRGAPVALGVTKKDLGKNVDKMQYTYEIHSEKIDSMRNVYNKYSKVILDERKK